MRRDGESGLFIGRHDLYGRGANEKAGDRRMGLFEREAYRSGAWIDDWMGAVFPEQVFTRE